MVSIMDKSDGKKWPEISDFFIIEDRNCPWEVDVDRIKYLMPEKRKFLAEQLRLPNREKMDTLSITASLTLHAAALMETEQIPPELGSEINTFFEIIPKL